MANLENNTNRLIEIEERLNKLSLLLKEGNGNSTLDLSEEINEQNQILDEIDELLEGESSSGGNGSNSSLNTYNGTISFINNLGLRDSADMDIYFTNQNGEFETLVHVVESGDETPINLTILANTLLYIKDHTEGQHYISYDFMKNYDRNISYINESVIYYKLSNNYYAPSMLYIIRPTANDFNFTINLLS